MDTCYHFFAPRWQSRRAPSATLRCACGYRWACPVCDMSGGGSACLCDGAMYIARSRQLQRAIEDCSELAKAGGAR